MWWLHNPRNLCIWVDLHMPSGESEQALANLVPRPPLPPFFWLFAVCLTLIKCHSQAKPVPIPFFFTKTCCKLHVNYAVLCFRFSGKVQDAEMWQCSSSQVPEVTASPRALESYLSHVISLCAFQLKHLFCEWTVILPVLFSYPAKCFFVWPLFTAYQAKNFGWTGNYN